MNATKLLGLAFCLVAVAATPADANTEYFFSGQACQSQTASYVTNFGSSDDGRGNESTTVNSAVYCEVLGYEDRDVDIEGSRVYYWDQNGHSTNGYLYALVFAKEQDGTYTASGFVGSSSTAGGTSGFGTATHTGRGYLDLGGMSAATDVVTYGFYVVLPRETSGNTSFVMGYQIDQVAD